MKTIVTLLLTLFAMNTLALDSPPRQKGILKADSGGVLSVAFSPDSQTVAAGCVFGINFMGRDIGATQNDPHRAFWLCRKCSV